METTKSYGTALITGASSGIGAALALEFARQNFDVVLAARRTEKINKVAEEIEKLGRKALAVTCDVTKDGDLEKAVAEARQKFGALDVVVANAGFGVVGNVERLNIEDFRRQFETNVFGVLRTVYASFAALKESKGRLAIIGSVNGYLALPGSSPYAMSKFAVRALAESLHFEMKSAGVSITHIAPGFIGTEIRQIDNKGQRHERPSSEVPAWLNMPAEQAASQIVKAILNRKREAVITNHGKLAVSFQRHAPGLLGTIIKMAKISKRAEPGTENVTT